MQPCSQGNTVTNAPLAMPTLYPHPPPHPPTHPGPNDDQALVPALELHVAAHMVTVVVGVPVQHHT
jgi:hypothetical protein